MSKTNVQTNVQLGNQLVWNEYVDKPFDQALPKIYSIAENISKALCDWYWKHIKYKRRLAFGILICTFILLVVGTIFPIYASTTEIMSDRFWYTQRGVIALAIAGLLQVADRVFGMSSGWLRYMKTVTSIENLTREFEQDWASYTVDKGGKLSNEDVKPLFEKAKTFETDIVKLQIDETEQWATEFRTSLASLGETIKFQRESADKAVEAARTAIESQEKAQKSGAVELKIAHKTAPVELLLAIDNMPEEKFTGLLWAKNNLRPGQHTVSIKPLAGVPIIQKIVDIPPGGVVQAEVEVSFA